MNIAVFIDQNNNTLPLYESGMVQLFSWEKGSWELRKKIPFEATLSMGIAETRRRMKALVRELENCNVFIAKNIKGVPYSILEGMGFSIWKIDGSPMEFLDYVKKKEEEILEAKRNPKPAPKAVGDLRDGYYRINLVEALESDKTLTSKQILLPFLQKNVFDKLEIICDCMPRWFEREAGPLKVKLRSMETVEGLCHALVVPED